MLRRRPEMKAQGYRVGDKVPGRVLHAKYSRYMQRIAAETKGVALVVGYPKAEVGGLFNVAGLVSDGRVVAEYAKQLLPNYSVFDEKRYFQPGSAPCVVEHDGVRLGLTVCEDIWEEGPARQAAETGAQLLVNINASPYHTGKAPEREELIVLRAREHRMPIVYANLVGGQDELIFDGGSFVVDADGELTQRAPFFEEDMMVADVKLGEVPRPLPGHVAPFPTEQEAVYGALVLGVRDYVRKSGFQGAVLGLSGGIVVANPIPARHALEDDEIDAVIDEALGEMGRLGIIGKDTTPFLLARIAERTAGRSLAANIELVVNNALLAAEIATAL